MIGTLEGEDRMEDKGLKETWDWLEEDCRLDSESPLGVLSREHGKATLWGWGWILQNSVDLRDIWFNVAIVTLLLCFFAAISQSLWDDFAQNEAVARTLFASTPASHVKESVPSSFSSGNQDCSDPSSSGHAMRDWSPIMKRRRMLQFSGEHIDVRSEPLENCSDSFIEVYGDFQAHRPSPSSMWYMANEESFSSANDAVEQTPESWMAGCFSESDTNGVQDLANRYPVGFGVPIVATTPATDACSSRQASCGSKPGEVLISRQYADTQSRQLAERSLHLESQLGKKPVAYPFAVVKPSGIQGDITLKDINRRIMAPPSRREALGRCETSRISSASSPSGLAFSGKSVVALTKIHTEGKGTITIMRTRK